MKATTSLLLALSLAGCAAASRAIPAADLGVTAKDGFLEARTLAVGWDADARLRWVEGRSIAASGLALPGVGEWGYHFTAPGQAQELVVVVAPGKLEQDTSAVTSPPGYVIGDRALGVSWVDSPAVLEAVAGVREGGAVGAASLLLVPTSPAQWVVRFPEADSRRWRVDATTGAMLGT